MTLLRYHVGCNPRVECQIGGFVPTLPSVYLDESNYKIMENEVKRQSASYKLRNALSSTRKTHMNIAPLAAELDEYLVTVAMITNFVALDLKYLPSADLVCLMGAGDQSERVFENMLVKYSKSLTELYNQSSVTFLPDQLFIFTSTHILNTPSIEEHLVWVEFDKSRKTALAIDLAINMSTWKDKVHFDDFNIVTMS